MDSITKEHLDVRICDVMEGATNEETFREFITNSEKEFYMQPRDLDSMNDEELNAYLEFLSYLWNK